MIYVRMVCLLAALLLVSSGPSMAATYYLSPDGNDGNPGSLEAPWQSLEKASEAAQAGDTVVLLPGSYEGQLRPVSSGTADAPIVFRAEPRLGARLLGLSGERTVELVDIEHVRVEGLHVDPEGSGRGWLTIRNSSHVVVDDCRMENSTLGLAGHIDDSEDVTVRNSVFHKQTGGINMFRISSATRLLFEGNSISRAGHSPLQFFPQNTNRYMVIRGNIFHAAWGRNFEFFHDNDVLFEHNIIAHAFNSGWSGSSNAKLGFTRGIIRFNRIFANPHGAISMYPWREDGFLRTMRLYNNVWDDTGQRPISVSSRSENTQDVLFQNNIFSRNDPWGLPGRQQQITLAGGTPEQVRLVHNVFTGREPGLKVVTDYGEDFTADELHSEALRAEHGARYEGNLDVDPGYVGAENYNHALREDSPLRDAGSALTTAAGAGEGTLIAVEDAAFFYDGFGIAGEQGDLIAVGTADQKARVVEVDHDANTLLVDRAVTWQAGDPVSLAWSGEAPDIGVYEHGPDGRVAAQAVVEPFKVHLGEEVTLRAVVHGDAQPRQIRWWLGDGNVAEGAEVTHRYEEEYDYAIRLEVIDADGHSHRAAGYVLVEEALDPSAPLIHSTWGPEDDSAWRLWKSYAYPGPAGYMDVVEGGVRHGPNSRHIPAGYEPPGDGVNYRHVRVPEDRGGLPTRLHPAGWDIDRYPEVFVRYRMGEGTPLMLTLKPFGRPGIILAINPAYESSLARIGDAELHDDGQWHELVFDVREAREIYPDLQRPEGLYFVRTSQDAVKEGQWYDLDEVIIRPGSVQ